MKRKREGAGRREAEEGNMEEAFRSSKKTLRSPVKMGEEGEMKKLLREMRGMRKEIREVVEGQKEMMRKEVERIKEELREREEKWQREKGEMMERLKVLEGELWKMTIGAGEREGEEVKKGEGEKIWLERIRRLERKSEWREREERKRNIVVKGVKVGGEREIERKLKEILGNI
ncbi:hypothetical protein ALC57_09611 [Trachymyrmex cornetzi]|uniref:Uncharacterized protein n=1 Tax=Trachymyrmex cornetzi TaxID=471704 RepID=A0A195DZ09_9HYME|nr:hypothetical protein ALC57_09611 [Trachymyrmex cornetzi]